MMQSYVDFHCPHCKRDTRIPFIEPSVRLQLSTTVDDLPFSVRTHNSLKNEQISTVGQLVQMKKAELLRRKWIGRKSFNEIREVLANMSLSLADEELPLR